MKFDYYTSISVQLAVDLINTFQAVTGNDMLVNEADLKRFLVKHGETVKVVTAEKLADKDERAAVDNMYHTAVYEWEIRSKDVESIRELRGHLRTVFEKAANDERYVAEILNEQLRIYRATPRISWGHGSLHLHFESVEDGCAHWLAATTTMGLAVILCELGGERFGICTSPSCHAAFIDTSKNKRKRFCSEACAHRESVAAFRARQRSNQTSRDVKQIGG